MEDSVGIPGYGTTGAGAADLDLIDLDMEVSVGTIGAGAVASVGTIGAGAADLAMDLEAFMVGHYGAAIMATETLDSIEVDAVTTIEML